MLSAATETLLNAIPLTKVMEENGHTIAYRTAKEAYYRCPFHNEETASFKVDLHPTGGHAADGSLLAGYHCFGCDKGGWGALMLQAALMGVSLKEHFREVADKLAKMANLVIEGDHKNGFWHRAKEYAEPKDEICILRKEGFTHAELRALGCEVQQIFTRDYRKPEEERAATDEEKRPLYKYSWGEGFYKRSCNKCNFDPSVLAERFGLYALSGFITEKRTRQRDGKEVSYEVKATDTYPIFAFCYEDKKGWWLKKYEPLFRQVADAQGNLSPNYKFTWWYQNGVSREEELSRYMYGDTDVMRALAGEPVETRDASHPTVTVTVKEGRNRAEVKKFKRLIICSGPRDAMNVYFHSDAHVCYPHSEGVDIPAQIIFRLREIANEIFILYDIDKTGVKMADRLAMRFLDLKVIYLPQELKSIRSSRTGKPCKDAEEYFNFFPSVLNNIEAFYGADINTHFANLLADAKPMCFWTEKATRHNKNTEDEYTTIKYTMNVDNMNQFLYASGMCAYGKGGSVKFANVGTDNIVDVVDSSEATIMAKMKMKNYLKNNHYYNRPDLSNAISDTKRLNLSTLSEMPVRELDFRAWGSDFDYFYFADAAYRVTADAVERVPYAKMSYYVNRGAILSDVEFEPIDMRRYFEIIPNPQLDLMQKQYEVRKHNATKEEKRLLKIEFKAKKKLWEYQLVWNTPIEKCPPIIQFVYDLSRMFWKREAENGVLTEEERQFQDMHFINKVVGMGYILSRFRTPMRQHMVMITDYNIKRGEFKNKASGRNGKTTLMRLLGLVRKGLEGVPGANFHTNPDKFATNFSKFQRTKDSFVGIDDLHCNVGPEVFYNLTEQLQTRSYYHDMEQTPLEESPKIVATMNNPFDLSVQSTYGRVWPMLVSDYYHEEAEDGSMDEWTPGLKFGCDFVKGCSEEEKQLNRNLLVYCLQCYLKYASEKSGVLRPPLGYEGSLSLASAEIGDPKLMRFLSVFFAKAWHFERPISRKEMYIDFCDSAGIPVNRATVGTNHQVFWEKVRIYCKWMNISMNPPIVLTTETDKKVGSPRVAAWETVFDGDIPASPHKRTLQPSVRCVYFYRIGEIPRDPKQILQAPDTDPEA